MWTSTLPPETILLYNDGTTTSAWHCVQGPQQMLLFEGCCQIDKHCDIEDGEIHAILEGLRALRDLSSDWDIWLTVKNENAIIALAGGQSAGRQLMGECLEDVKIWHQRGLLHT